MASLLLMLVVRLYLKGVSLGFKKTDLIINLILLFIFLVFGTQAHSGGQKVVLTEGYVIANAFLGVPLSEIRADLVVDALYYRSCLEDKGNGPLCGNVNMQSGVSQFQNLSDIDRNSALKNKNFVSKYGAYMYKGYGKIMTNPNFKGLSLQYEVEELLKLFPLEQDIGNGFTTADYAVSNNVDLEELNVLISELGLDISSLNDRTVLKMLKKMKKKGMIIEDLIGEYPWLETALNIFNASQEKIKAELDKIREREGLSFEEEPLSAEEIKEANIKKTAKIFNSCFPNWNKDLANKVNFCQRVYDNIAILNRGDQFNDRHSYEGSEKEFKISESCSVKRNTIPIFDIGIMGNVGDSLVSDGVWSIALDNAELEEHSFKDIASVAGSLCLDIEIQSRTIKDKNSSIIIKNDTFNKTSVLKKILP